MTYADILVLVAGVLWTIDLVPQLAKTIHSKSVGDLSPATFTLSLTAYILFNVGCFMKEQYIIVLSHLLPFVLLLWILALILRYKNKHYRETSVPFTRKETCTYTE